MKIYAAVKNGIEEYPMSRVTKADVKEAFHRLCQALGKKESYNEVGGWRLDYNPQYGGWIVEEICNRVGGVTCPLGYTRLPTHDFYYALNFATNVVNCQRGMR